MATKTPPSNRSYRSWNEFYLSLPILDETWDKRFDLYDESNKKIVDDPGELVSFISRVPLNFLLLRNKTE